jgi:DNA-binding response OmpR family regulator
MELGHPASVTASTADAGAAVAEGLADVVFLDIDLPSAVPQLCDSIRDQGLPVVVLSSAEPTVVLRACLQLDALDFLPKPIEEARLGELLSFLELHLLNRQAAERVRRLDRRQHPRVAAEFAVRIVAYTGAEWAAEAVDLSPLGIRVRSRATVGEGESARLRFTPPDGPPPLTVDGVVVHRDVEDVTFSFLNLTHGEFARLREVVDALGRRPTDWLAARAWLARMFGYRSAR